jgi:SAM-dependent methyltransferase
METPRWLHGQLAEVAARCVGVDYNEQGVRKMVELGFDARFADLDSIVNVFADERFELIVAGELIEHLSNPQTLFERARDLLAPSGRFVVTTPNPYARHRVIAGRLRTVWENVDHVTYHFPAGMVELAERSDLEVRRFTSIRDPRGTWDRRLATKQARNLVSSLLRRRPPAPQLVTELLAPLVGTRTGSWVGETSIYIFGHRSPTTE